MASRDAPDERVVIEIQLRNTSDTAFYLPRLRDPWDAHQQGEKGRRTFLFMLRFLGIGEVQADKVIALTVSAKTIPDSLLRIGPNESVLVRLPRDLTGISDRVTVDMTEIRVQIVCKEWTLADDRYFIERRSEEVVSENTVQLAIQPASSSPIE